MLVPRESVVVAPKERELLRLDWVEYPRSLRERVAEDQSREVHIRETIEREREASAVVRDLRQQLMQERESHEEEIKSQGQILAELK